MSGDFLSKLTPVKRGMSPAQVAAPERIEAIQQALKALWAGENVTTRGGMRVNGGSSGLSLEPIKAVENRQGHRFTPLFAHGQLRIGLGTVAVGFADGGRVIEPYYPKFEGKRLDAAEAPAKSLADMEEGDYQIVVIFCFTDGRVKVVRVDEELEKQDDEWVVQVATFTKLAGGGVEKVVHKWRSDILICCGDISCASDSGSDSGMDSSDDGSDSDSDSDGSEPPFSDSSDSSDDSSGGGEDNCCPDITVTANVYSVGQGYDNDCFTFTDTAENVEIGVTVNVLNNPCGCRNAFLRVQVAGGTPQYRNLGFAGMGSEEFFFNISAMACQDITVTACWMTSVGIAGGAGTGEECQGNQCCASTVVRMPGVCGGSPCSSSDSSSGDDSGGGDPGSDDSTTSSSGVSSSDDPGSEKTAIVRLSSSPTGLAKLFCMEGTESWFVTFATYVLTGRGGVVTLPKNFLEVCEQDKVFVACVQQQDGRRVAARLVSRNQLCLRVRSWVWPWTRTEVTVMLVGIRRGHDHGELPPATAYELMRNEAFLKLAR